MPGLVQITFPGLSIYLFAAIRCFVVMVTASMSMPPLLSHYSLHDLRIVAGGYVVGENPEGR
jgi:hypothetical protein